MTLTGLDNCRDDFGDLSGNAVYYAYKHHNGSCAECVTTGKVSPIAGAMLLPGKVVICDCGYHIKGAINQSSAPKKAKQARTLETID